VGVDSGAGAESRSGDVGSYKTWEERLASATEGDRLEPEVDGKVGVVEQRRCQFGGGIT
jgi:hypothetical protein